MQQAVQPPQAPPAHSRKLRWGLGLSAAVIGLLPLGWYLGARYVWFNIHDVVPGQVYRSSQPSPAFLKQVIAEKNIRCVLKLNSPKESDWSKAELDAEGQFDGVKWINLPMGVSRLPTTEELVALVDAIDSAPRPMLIHCKIGADRTSVASALVAMHDGMSFEEAVASQLSLRYMHVGHIGEAVEDIFARYRADQAKAGKPLGGWDEFRDYVRTAYHQTKNTRK